MRLDITCAKIRRHLLHPDSGASGTSTMVDEAAAFWRGVSILPTFPLVFGCIFLQLLVAAGFIVDVVSWTDCAADWWTDGDAHFWADGDIGLCAVGVVGLCCVGVAGFWAVGVVGLGAVGVVGLWSNRGVDGLSFADIVPYKSHLWEWRCNAEIERVFSITWNFLVKNPYPSTAVYNFSISNENKYSVFFCFWKM